ncbi:MAG: tetratricopeptide repeat protein [Desulfobulbaceae bacterium]|nr:MAG: tetratricopeptide repeat protein [Desulfobulbaceae bacterium]
MKNRAIGLLALLFLSLSVASAVGSNSFESNSKIASLISSGSFSKANELLTKIEADKRIDDNGLRELESVYNSLKDYNELESLNEWCSHSPAVSYPFIVRGNYFLNQAQRYLHPHDANFSGIQRIEAFGQNLDAAQRDFETAHELDPTQPAASAGMVSISNLRGYPSQVMETWFLKAVEADPLWLGTYTNKLHYLSPHRNGSVNKMYEFAVMQTEKAPEGGSVYRVLFEYFDILNSFHFPVEQNFFYVLNLPSKAHKLFQPTLEQFKVDYPRSTIPLLYQGKYKFLQSEPDSAITLFSTILTQDPCHVAALQGRIVAYLQKNELKKAEADSELLVTIAPDFSFGLANRGTISALLNGDTQKAKSLYTEAIEIEKSPYKRFLYYLDLATLLASQNEYQEALGVYNQLLELRPNSEKALIGRAESKYHSGQIESAIEDLLKVIDLGGRRKVVAAEKLETYREQLNKKQPNHKNSQKPVVASEHRNDVQTADIVTTMPPKPKASVNVGEAGKVALKCEGFYYRKMTREAIDCYASLLAITPRHEQGQTYFMLGQIAEKQEYNLAKAINYYGLAIDGEPENERYITKLGELFYLTQQFDHAIAVFSKLIEINEFNGKAYYYRGLCLDEKGQREAAIKEMQRARAYDPSIIEAERYLNKFAGKQPVAPKISQVDQLLSLAEENMRLNRFDEAEQHYKELLKINGNHDYAHFRLGILYRSRDRDHGRAILQFDKAIALNTARSDYYLNRASALSFLGRCDAAIEDLSKLIELKPTYAPAFSDRGTCYMKVGEYMSAEQDFQTALKYSPGTKSYMRKLAEANAQTGSTLISSEDVGMLIETAKVNVAKKNYAEAEKNFTRAIELDPNNSEPCYLMGKLMDEKLKDKERAIEFYSRAIQLNPRNRDYYFKRGLIYYHQQHYAKSIPDFDNALTLSPNDGQILYYRGNCHRKLGNKNQAIDDYLKVKEYAPSWTEAVNSHLEALM